MAAASYVPSLCSPTGRGAQRTSSCTYAPRRRHRHSTRPGERGKIWSGTSQQGTSSTKRHEEIHRFFFSFSCSSCVQHPPKVNSTEINLSPCSGRPWKSLVVAAFTLTERHSLALAFSHSTSCKTWSSQHSHPGARSQGHTWH